MTFEERKAKAHKLVEQYSNEAHWWDTNIGSSDPRSVYFCARFAVALEMYETLTGEKYN